MSILIKCMEMPKEDNISHVILHIHSDGTCAVTGKVYETEGGVPVAVAAFEMYGEAVEVPTPHGRLIDADELPKIAYEHMDDTALAGLENAFERMPTIIEAEE